MAASQSSSTPLQTSRMGVQTAQDCVVGGLGVVAGTQPLASVQVRVWVPPLHALQGMHDQDEVHAGGGGAVPSYVKVGGVLKRRTVLELRDPGNRDRYRERTSMFRAF